MSARIVQSVCRGELTSIGTGLVKVRSITYPAAFASTRADHVRGGITHRFRVSSSWKVVLEFDLPSQVE